MKLDMIINLMQPTIYGLIPVLWIIQEFLKLNDKFNREWVIPYAIFFISIIFSILIIGQNNNNIFNFDVYVTGVIQGVIVSGIVVLGGDVINGLFIKK
jgi:hypothetical protein